MLVGSIICKHAGFSSNEHFRRAKFDSKTFAIAHYAGDVVYHTVNCRLWRAAWLLCTETGAGGVQAGMIERNKGLLIADHESLLHESSNGLVRQLAVHAGEGKDLDIPNASPARRRAATLTKTTKVKCELIDCLVCCLFVRGTDHMPAFICSDSRA